MGRHSISKGSSPLARGLRGRVRRVREESRIIPARAGFTRPGKELLMSSADHPRSRGVYRHARSSRGVGEGSSPLARGLHAIEKGEEFVYRIIPARAGFTLLRISE